MRKNNEWIDVQKERPAFNEPVILYFINDAIKTRFWLIGFLYAQLEKGWMFTAANGWQFQCDKTNDDVCAIDCEKYEVITEPAAVEGSIQSDYSRLLFWRELPREMNVKKTRGNKEKLKQGFLKRTFNL